MAKKTNLDISANSFSKMTLENMNMYLEKLAKRYNQRVKDFYKKDPYHALEIYRYNNVEVGKPVFSRRKATTKEEAKIRFQAMESFNKSKYSTYGKFKKYRYQSMITLAENVGFVSKGQEMPKEDREILSGFFDYVYVELKMDKELYNYKELRDFYSVFKLSKKEKQQRLEDIKSMWDDFMNSKTDLMRWTMAQEERIRKEKEELKDDYRPVSEIIREQYHKSKG